jgi:hypothetical protein
MIPALDADGNLPPGIHDTTWSELVSRYGTTPQRKKLLHGLRRATTSLAAASCKALLLDGSFVTDKADPGDFDGCWDPAGVDPTKLDPVLLRFENRRAAQKAKYFGELFPSTAIADSKKTPPMTFLEFFQLDKSTGKPKGLLRLDLKGWKP